MLDTETKRRIDTARDILVGKVPDPKSQVEQITIALIYKFMDDMDAESEELGGKRKFFADDFSRYGWTKLMRSGLGGHETLNLYAEAIARMPENPGIPLLFREIFKNAYLPYRDPETLRAFLKVIDEFTYDHSERLGDAFEYLLSVLGSQGDAGQFRTPRHIIDFMVQIIDPKKTETILDPACGTAGFLISSYKHILKSNTDGQGHTILTPEEKGKLAKNFKGYDISPDMVRLSLVNLYLHGFSDPHIYEYDTLTSQDRWNEYADVILANPPFMSPKGGIQPHKRFSVQSKRSEVLFVDYMAEHLTPNGRAAIIVPEGIIFQSQTAYVQLRKMLVENSLVAVISLPAGVFNPYAGVKTSILILNKSLAKQANTIAFYKIENDGFGLGAQRRPIDKNDIPQALIEINDYLNRLRTHQSLEDFNPMLGLVVPKEKISANGDYNLSGERYREGAVSISEYPFVKVGDIFSKSDVSILPSTLAGPVTYIGLENITQKSGKIEGSIISMNPTDIKSLKNVFKVGDILYGKLRPNLNKVWYADREGICSTDIFVIKPIDNRILPSLYSYLFRSSHFNEAVISELKGAQLPRVGWASFAAIEIPFPPLEVQKEIVEEIEGYQKVIDGAQAVVENYRPHIEIDPDWPMVAIRDLVVTAGVGLVKNKSEQSPNHPHPYVRMNNITKDGTLNLKNLVYVEATQEECKAFSLLDGDYLYNTRNSPELVGKSTVYHGESGKYLFNNNILRVRFNERALPDFVNWIMSGAHGQSKIKAQVDGTTSVAALYQRNYFAIEIPLPPIHTQCAIVAEIEAEQSLVNANRELISRFEKKIQATLARIWGEEEKSITDN